MICEIVRDESFLAQKSAEASFLDMPIAQNLLDTLAAYSDSCVGLAAKDNLQPLEVMEAFAKGFGAGLTVSPDSEHPFMGPEDEAIVEKWLTRVI